MGVFNNQNTFYNSTWHLYKLPLPGLQLLPLKLSVPKMQFPNYNQLWKLFRNNPFGIDSNLLPPPNNAYEPFPINPFSYTNYIEDYNDIYSNENPNTLPVSNLTINNVRMGLSGLTLAIDALGLGRTTGAGEKDANYYINAASKLGSNLPGVAGLVFSSIGAASSLVNTLAGSLLNKDNIKSFKNAIQDRARWLMGDTSTTDALIASSANNIDLKVPGTKYFGKDPLLSDILGYGVGKASGTAWGMKQPTLLANAQAHNTEALGYKNYQNDMIRLGLLSSYSKGGFLGNRYNDGGDINTPRTHGSLFNTGLTEINTGGRHSENLYGGVLFGVDPYGIPNLVEEGETIFNAESYGGPQDYAFSDEIEFPIKEYGHLFSLGGLTKHKKGKYKKYTFADVSKYLAKDIKLNPNSEIVKRTFAENAGKLANIQEEVKARDMIDQMNPMDVMMALQQSPMGELMVSDTLGSMDLQAMMEQEPMMAACGGKLHAYGGFLNNPYGANIFKYAGGIKRNKKKRVRGYNRKLIHKTKGLNYSKDDLENKILSLPESAKIHDDLFGKAITDYIYSKGLEFEKLLKEGKYEEAFNVATKLRQDLNLVNLLYVQAAKDPTNKDKVWAAQKAFDDLGLNAPVAEFLKQNPKVIFRGDGNDYINDNALDSIFGLISQNRFIQYDDRMKDEHLSRMGMTAKKYIDFLKKLGDPSYNLTDSDMDFLKELPMLEQPDITTDKIILNPNYKEGGNEPKYISLEDHIIATQAPEDVEDAKLWWENLPDLDKQKYLNKYGTVGNPTRTGVYTQLLLYNLTEAAKKAQLEAAKESLEEDTNTNKLLVPKPRNDWETMGSLGVALSDYIKSQFNIGMGERNPGADAAYSYLSRVGMIPMVRNHMVGTKHEYLPTDRNYRENIENNITRGDMRMLPNVNYGNSLTNFFALMNLANKKRAEALVLADETDRKERGFIYGNNNEVDKANAQGSLNAQTVNALNLARAREALATAAIQLSNTLSGNNKTWLDYQNQQSSGLADLLYKLGYNKQMFNARDAAWLANSQQLDTATIGGILFDVYDNYNDFFKNKMG